jgi:hypothetical protein
MTAGMAVFQRVSKQHKLSQKLTPIFVQSPELEDCCKRLGDFIGDRFVGLKAPLILEMLEGALKAYRAAKKDGQPHIAFTQGLFEPAQRLYAKRYVARRGESLRVWYPMDEPITSFESRHSDYVLEMIDEPCIEVITKRTAAFQLAARVLRGEIFRLYFEDYDVPHHITD